MRGRRLNLILLILTFMTTIFAGCLLSGEQELNRRMILTGISFSVALMSILGIHELGHYYASLSHGVKATLPYFIPAPSIIGTFGAFIKIKSGIGSRRALFDIGIAGPLAGFSLALPLFVLGVSLSKIVPVMPSEGALRLGNSILVHFLIKLALLHDIPAGYDIMLHPIAFAAWIGFWVTALNLLPIGQLDGGHITYSLFPKQHKIISTIVIALLIPLGYLWAGWLIWALIILLLLGLGHPPPADLTTPIDSRRKILGLVALIIFILIFTPKPFSV